ncbi:uncharacterized protein N7498_000017 [Penicillium cinerascens]|uniref:Zn(2)-C6 fungal-type domain-containing protein n=1 Tax=Penicillium cinerascens TaxID=70096 RepID=A0A9W9NDM0_9EURO|nr:uncharacterized protein N7498_000017 [Penicillium cinerascens]KAJ5217918.1 hypothetical protein N7498_000017 [Penicillium cinerascens]
MVLRRPHRKSRHSCLDCKRRRVKCDEARPDCFKCVKRHVKCEYDPSISLIWTIKELPRGLSDQDFGISNLSGSTCSMGSVPVSTGNPTTTPGSLSLLNNGANSSSRASVLNLHDLKLMMQWCNTTYHTLSHSERTDIVWRNNVPEEALSHSFLMHEILALSALHLARTGTGRYQCSILGDINESNIKAMFAFTNIIVVYTFGFPATPDVLDPLASVGSLYQVLDLTRSILKVVRSPSNYLKQTNFAAMLQVEPIRAQLPDDAPATINQLYEANEVCSTRNRSYETGVYTIAIGNITEMLSWVYGGMTASMVARCWVIRLPARFMELLREREPMALGILAHYCVLLHALRHRLCFGEWCISVAKAVWAILDDQWRPVVDWAMRAILGTNYIEKMTK